MAGIPVEVDLASEFRYRNPILDERTLVIAISQSGETADTLAALNMAKAKKGQHFVLHLGAAMHLSGARRLFYITISTALPHSFFLFVSGRPRCTDCCRCMSAPLK